MTQAGHGHGHEEQQLPFPGFRPSNDFGVLAQSAQLKRVREARDQQVAEARAAADQHEDRSVFYEACLAQLQQESQQQIGNLAEALSTTRTALAEAQREIEQLKNPQVVEGEVNPLGIPIAHNGEVSEEDVDRLTREG